MSFDLTVVICVYNGERFIGGCLRSVFEQTPAPAEVVVLDDASTDGTLEILQNHRDRITLLRHEQNQGLGAARRHAVEHVRTEWVCFLDADDVWLPCKVETIRRILARFPGVDMIVDDFRDWDEASKRLAEHTFLETKRALWETGAFEHRGTDCFFVSGERLFPVLLVECFASAITATLRTDLVRQCGNFDAAFRRAQDVDLFYRYARIAQGGACIVRRVTVKRRLHEHNLTRQEFLGDYFQARAMGRHWKAVRRQPEPWRTLALNTMQKTHRHAAFGALRAGKPGLAAGLLLRSFLGRPNLQDLLLLSSISVPRSLRRRLGRWYERRTGRHPAEPLAGRKSRNSTIPDG